MIKVYEIDDLAVPPFGGFESYARAASDENKAKMLRRLGNGKPFPSKWNPIELYIDTPNRPHADFFGFTFGILLCNERSREIASEPLEMSGELLPVSIEGLSERFWIFNPTNCLNVIDAEKSGWRFVGRSKEFRELYRPHFIAERFGLATLFKIPEDGYTRLYCFERSGDPEDGEFKAIVETNGLTGLRFKEVWAQVD